MVRVSKSLTHSDVRYKNSDGTLNMALLGKDSAHWSYLLDTKGSIMYGNGWRDNGDGTFTSTAARSGYSPLDLYLMGIIDKTQVPPMLLIVNPAIDKTQLPQLGATISGTSSTVSIDDIIAAEGVRVPDSTTSQKKFNVGFVLLSRPGDNTTTAAQAIETLRQAWAGRFAALTQGTGGISNVPASLNININSPADGTTISGPYVTVSGAVINTSGAETGIIVNGIVATVNGSSYIANHVPLQAGSNPIKVTATDANALTNTITRNVTAQAGNYIRIVPNIDSGTAPLNISLTLDGSFTIINPTMMFSGPVPVTLTQGTSPSEFTVQLTVEGSYTISVNAIGPDGQTYSDVVTITVLSTLAMDNLFRSKWNNLTGSLAKGDSISALNLISTQARPMYQDMFTALAGQLPSIVSTQHGLNLLSITQNQGMYELVTQENGTIYSYEIIFAREVNGLWLLYEF